LKWDIIPIYNIIVESLPTWGAWIEITHERLQSAPIAVAGYSKITPEFCVVGFSSHDDKKESSAPSKRRAELPYEIRYSMRTIQ
jgi:hypothetical protein